jgi:hypothetical protein
VDRKAPHNPRARAHICYPEAHTKLRFGPRLAYLRPDHEVKAQNEPTPGNLVSQHKQFKGHRAGGAHVVNPPSLKGVR